VQPALTDFGLSSEGADVRTLHVAGAVIRIERLGKVSVAMTVTVSNAAVVRNFFMSPPEVEAQFFLNLT
jgi:hypothetical protein